MLGPRRRDAKNRAFSRKEAQEEGAKSQPGALGWGFPTEDSAIPGFPRPGNVSMVALPLPLDLVTPLNSPVASINTDDTEVVPPKENLPLPVVNQ